MLTVQLHAPIPGPKRRLDAVRRGRIAASALILALAGSAHAQTMIVRPYLNARVTYTDNVGADEAHKSDLSVEVAPGISIRRQGGRLVGGLNALLRNVAYLNESERNDTFLALSGNGHFEAVERMLFVDMDASMSRSNRSLLFGRAAGDPLDTASDNETYSFGIGPRLQFRLGDQTSGTISYMMHWLGGGGLDSRQQGNWRAQLSNASQFGRFGWGLDYNYSGTDSADRGANAVSQEVVRATLYATVTPQFRLRGIVGHERNDYEVAAGESNTIVGGGFDWNPTDRTVISGTTEKRVFGRGYNFQFSHRQALSVWNLSYSRDISSSLQALGFDVFSDPEFRALFDALERVAPDPLLREALVRRLLGYPPIGTRDTFFTNVHFVTRNLTGSASFIGARNVLTFVVQQSERDRLGGAVTTNPRDDFARFDAVKTRSGTVALSHRLSQQTSFNASVVRSRSEGGGGTNVVTRRTLLNVGLAKQFSPRTSGALTYSYQRSDGGGDFIENALTASVSMSF